MKSYIFLSILLFISCNSSTKVRNDLIKLNSSPIVIPTDMSIVCNGKDTIK